MQTQIHNPFHIIWKRGSGQTDLTFTSPMTFYSEGMRGSGKSTLIEAIGLQYLQRGACLLDMFGSVDAEGLAILRSDLVKESNFKILLLKGENVDVNCSWTTRTIDQVSLGDFEKYDIVISARPLFQNREAEYYSIGRLSQKLYTRFYWNRLIFGLVREASSLWFSRMMLSGTQSDMKTESAYVLRESRHVGLGLALDSLRWTGIDRDFRAHLDMTFIKACGIEGLADEMRFLYSFFSPLWVRAMKPYQFIVVSRKGPLGAGWLEFHDWHKKEGENMLKQLDIKIEVGEELKLAEDRGTHKTVSDLEHVEFIDEYFNGKGMRTIALSKGRSSRTILEHVHSHNASVERSGFCASCKRAGSPHHNQKAQRKGKGDAQPDSRETKS